MSSHSSRGTCHELHLLPVTKHRVDRLRKHSDPQPRGDFAESRESTVELVGSAVPMDRVVASDRTVCIYSEGRLHETIKKLSSEKEDI